MTIHLAACSTDRVLPTFLTSFLPAGLFAVCLLFPCSLRAEAPPLAAAGAVAKENAGGGSGKPTCVPGATGSASLTSAPDLGCEPPPPVNKPAATVSPAGANGRPGTPENPSPGAAATAPLQGPAAGQATGTTSAGTTSPAANPSNPAQPNSATNSGTSTSRPDVDLEIPATRIASVRHGSILFSLRRFPDMRVGDVVLILNDDLTGVVADARVRTISSDHRAAAAEISRLAPGREAESLRRAAVIRLADVKGPLLEKFGGGPLKVKSDGADATRPPDVAMEAAKPLRTLRPSLNPSALLAFEGEMVTLTSANLLSGSALDPVTLAFGASLESFLPRIQSALWPNWFGGRVTTLALQEASLTARNTTSNGTRVAKVGGTDVRVDVLFRPTFDVRYLSRVGIGVTVYEQSRETFQLGPVSGDPGTDASLSLSGFGGMFLTYEMLPLPFLFLGVDATLPLPRTFTAHDGANPLAPDATITDARAAGMATFGLRVPFSRGANRFLVESRLSAALTRDTYSGSPALVQTAAGSQFTNWLFRLTIGIGFVH